MPSREALALTLSLALGVVALSIILVPPLRRRFRDVNDRRPRVVSAICLLLVLAGYVLGSRPWPIGRVAVFAVGAVLGAWFSPASRRDDSGKAWALAGGMAIGATALALPPTLRGFPLQFLLGVFVGSLIRRVVRPASPPSAQRTSVAT